MNRVEDLLKSFRGQLSVNPESFREGELGVSCIATCVVAEQPLQMYLFWDKKSSRWVVAGISRQADNLQLFRAKELFGLMKYFTQFRLALFEGQLMLAVFSSRENKMFLQQVIPLACLTPKSADISLMPPLGVSPDGDEFIVMGADIGELYKLKMSYAREHDFDKVSSKNEEFWVKFVQSKLSKRSAEADRQRIAEVLARQAAKDEKREMLKARPKVTVFVGEHSFSGRPISEAEYAANDHCVLGAKTAVVVVASYDDANDSCGEPKKYFVIAKPGGQVEETEVKLELSFQRKKKPVEAMVMSVATIMVVVKDAPYQALEVTREQLEALRARGLNSGTPFVYKDAEPDPKGRPIVYKLFSDRIDTLGPADQVMRA